MNAEELAGQAMELLLYMREAALADPEPNMHDVYATLVGDICSELLEAWSSYCGESPAADHERLHAAAADAAAEREERRRQK